MVRKMPGEMRKQELNNILLFAWAPKMKSTGGGTLKRKVSSLLDMLDVEGLQDIQMMKPNNQVGIYTGLKVRGGF